MATILEGYARAALVAVAAGPDGRIEYASPAAEPLFGSLMGLDLSSPPECEDPRSPLGNLIRIWEASQNETDSNGPALIRAKSSGGSTYFWVQVIPLGAGGVGGRLILLADLTTHITGSEPVRRLVSQLAHDLRSPLTSIAGAAELLLSGRVGALAGAQQKLVKIVDEGSSRMNAIIRNVSEEGREGGTAA